MEAVVVVVVVEGEAQDIMVPLIVVVMAMIEGMNKVGIHYLYLMIVDEESAEQVQLTLDQETLKQGSVLVDHHFQMIQALNQMCPASMLSLNLLKPWKQYQTLHQHCQQC